MTDRKTKIIDGMVQVQPFLQSLYTLITRALETGPVAVDVYRPEDARNNDQNAKGWALWSDISKQVEWYGQKLTPEHWKELLSHDWKAQQIVPAINGGFCAIGVRTSKMTKRDFSSLIEITYAFGSSKGVKWSDKAIKDYEMFMEINECKTKDQ